MSPLVLEVNVAEETFDDSLVSLFLKINYEDEILSIISEK